MRSRPGLRPSLIECLFIVAVILVTWTTSASQVQRSAPAAVPAPVLSPQTANHERISSALLRHATLKRIDSSPAIQSVIGQSHPEIADDLIQVVIHTSTGEIEAVKHRIQSLNGTFERSARDLVLGRIPLDRLEAIASVPEVKYMRLPRKLKVQQTTTEGLSVIGAATWHAAGRRGGGVRVGILDVGFSGYKSLIGTELPEIPASHVRSFAGDISGNGESHGTAIAEIVFDIAPAAELFLVNASNEVELENAVDWLIEQNVDVINASWAMPCSGPVDGSGWVNDLVARAAAAGIVWVTASGNYAQRHWSAPFADGDGNAWHDFANDIEGNTVYLNAGDELEVCIVWDDWTDRDQDYDLYLWTGNGTVLESSTDDQSGSSTDEPTESLSFTASSSGDYHVGIYSRRTTRSGQLHMYVYPPGTECAIEKVAEATPDDESSLLEDLRKFRDRVLSKSPFGRTLARAYYRHSPEVVRHLLRHPRLAIEAGALLRSSAPVIRSMVAEGRADRSSPVFITSQLVERAERVLDDLDRLGTPELQTDLRDFRKRAALASAMGQAAQQYSAWLFPSDTAYDTRPLGAYPEAGFMRFTTAASSLAPPADSADSLTVGGFNVSSLAIEPFSSRGPTADQRMKPDLIAPDGVCTVTYADCGTGGFMGTSASAAHATGAVALLREAFPDLSASDLRAELRARSIDVGTAGPDNASGKGRLFLDFPSSSDYLPAPDGLDPAGSGTSIWPTFRWDPVAGASSYRLMVARSANSLPANATTSSCDACVINTTVTSNSFSPPSRLDAATAYHWQVQGQSLQRAGVWSIPTMIETTPWPELGSSSPRDLIEDTGAWPASAPNATVITHGWRSTAMPDGASDLPWVREFAEKLCESLLANETTHLVIPDGLTKICQGGNWDVWVVDWETEADTALPWQAAGNAVGVGERVAYSLAAKGYGQIHLVGHSAGAKLIDTVATRLRKDANLKIHATFLDAYEPSRNPGLYGRDATWADNYVDTRPVVEMFGLDGTQLFLEHAYNIDVTPEGTEDPCDAFFLPWNTADCRHSRPYRFYGLSMDSAFEGDAGAADFDPVTVPTEVGFALSAEVNGDFEAFNENRSRGSACVMRGSECLPQTVVAYLPTFTMKAVSKTVQASAGIATWVLSNSIPALLTRLTLGLISNNATTSAPKLRSDTLAASAAASYVALDFSNSEPVDRLRLSLRFGADGDGLLRIFVDGLLVREADQRFLIDTQSQIEEIYVGGPRGTLEPGVHRIAFRLDSYGNRPAGVELTDLTLGLIKTRDGRRRAVRH